VDRGHGRLSTRARKARAWVAGEEYTEVVLLAGETSPWHRSTIARSTDRVLEQLPREIVESAQIVVRTDSAAVTHEFCDELRAARVNFLTGYDLTETVRSAVLAFPEAALRAAIDQDGGTARHGGLPNRPPDLLTAVEASGRISAVM